MPIVTIQVLEDADHSPIAHEAVQMLADTLGDFFGSDVAGTWVKLTYLPREHYAENRTTVSLQQRPVFVEILKATLPSIDARAAEARRVATLVAEALQRPTDNVHVLYLPAATERMAFGGELIRA
jgi:phenylpyruvate tautomerase PptA (4-oxalocrotonate tautomerase family)